MDYKEYSVSFNKNIVFCPFIALRCQVKRNQTNTRAGKVNNDAALFIMFVLGENLMYLISCYEHKFAVIRCRQNHDTETAKGLENTRQINWELRQVKLMLIQKL